MNIDFLKHVFEEHIGETAIIWNAQGFTYAWLKERIAFYGAYLKEQKICSGTVVALVGDFSPNSIALLLSLIETETIVVPFARAAPSGLDRKMEIAQIETVLTVDENDSVASEMTGRSAVTTLYEVIRERRHPGLVLFTSGTSGAPKAAVHDFTGLLAKFNTRRKSLRTVNFLLFDHWGGLNTLFHTLSNGGTVLAINDRSPDEVCRFIEEHGIELLPASPTFLNLMVISEAYRRYDLGSLKAITYGTEPMPAATLHRLNKIFPGVKLQQTYGLIELGVLRSKSKEDDSLWVMVGGEGYTTRVVDGILQIKADSAMLGYLNAPSPFSDDGYFITGDAVEVDGDFLKILGRKSEIINVGGDKVYPAEVENVIHQLDNIAEVTVYGEKNPLVGNIVCARVRLIHGEDRQELVRRLKSYCSERLQKFMVPVKIQIVDEHLGGERLKKKRQNVKMEMVSDGIH